MRDFEDAVQYHCALHANTECIVTRDVRHFRHADLPIFMPDAFLASLES